MRLPEVKSNRGVQRRLGHDTFYFPIVGTSVCLDLAQKRRPDEARDGVVPDYYLICGDPLASHVHCRRPT